MSHYCFQCGSELEVRHIDHRDREICPACGWIYYVQLKVGAAVLIEQGGRLLLLRRSYEPWLGTWMVPAGYVEADENPKNAAIREVYEETGLNVELGELFNTYYFDDDPRGKGVVFVYTARKISGEIRINGESSAAKYFHWHEIPGELSKGGHDTMIMAWRANAQQRESQADG